MALNDFSSYFFPSAYDRQFFNSQLSRLILRYTTAKNTHHNITWKDDRRDSRVQLISVVCHKKNCTLYIPKTDNTLQWCSLRCMEKNHCKLSTTLTTTMRITTRNASPESDRLLGWLVAWPFQDRSVVSICCELRRGRRRPSVLWASVRASGGALLGDSIVGCYKRPCANFESRFVLVSPPRYSHVLFRSLHFSFRTRCLQYCSHLMHAGRAHYSSRAAERSISVNEIGASCRVGFGWPYVSVVADWSQLSHSLAH